MKNNGIANLFLGCILGAGFMFFERLVSNSISLLIVYPLGASIFVILIWLGMELYE